MNKDEQIAALEEEVAELKETVKRKHEEAWSWFHTYADIKRKLDRTQEWLDRFEGAYAALTLQILLEKQCDTQNSENGKS